MKIIASGLALFMLAVSALPACADAVADRLKAIKADIDAVKGDTSDYTAASNKLKKDIADLGQMIAAKQLNDKGALVAYEFRGEAQQKLNSLNGQQKKPYDLALARSALADFDRVIAAGVEVKGWFVLDNVPYLAGLVAYNQLASVPLAYSYWDKCAAMNHAGCLNIMAGAHITGKGGVKIDFAQALALHKKVYLTGTGYVCAGAFSADSIALISHLTHTRFDNVDELTWFARANELLDKLGAEDRCGRAGVDLDEYLVRLARGESASAVLDRAGSRLKADDPQRAIVALFQGKIDDASLSKAAAHAKYDYERCTLHFDALWFDTLKGNKEAALAHWQALTEVPGQKCATELAYTKLLPK